MLRVDSKTSSPRLCSNGKHWQARWWSNGKRITVGIGAKSDLSRRQAEAKCRQIADEHARVPGMKDRTGRVPTLAEWAEDYMGLRDEIKDGTRRLDNTTIAYMKVKFGDARRLDQITAADADDFRAWLGKQPVRRNKKIVMDGDKPTRLSKQTVAKHLRHAKTVFERARKRKIIAYNPFEEVSAAAPAVTREWATVTLDDLDRILSECPTMTWRNLFALCRLAGLRRGEALRLQWDDIDRHASTMTIRPEGGQEGTKQRTRVVPISQDLWLRLWNCGGTGPCAGVSHFNLTRKAEEIIEAAGLTAYAKPFHTLRKNLESEWLAKYPVMAVCEWLGHAPAVAMKHYHKPTAELMAQVTGASGTTLAQTSTPDPQKPPSDNTPGGT